ncbi:MAG: type IV secretion system protein [Acidobacteriaceae bacterium]
MEILKYIADGCDALTTTVSPSVDALGLHMVIALATIMMVWFGVQEALASAQGGPGFNMAKFLNFFLLITFAYAFVKFYDSAIPGIGFSLQGFVRGGTNNLVQIIGTDTTTNMLGSIKSSLSQSGPGIVMMTAPYLILTYFCTQILLAILSALISVIIAYGAVGATIVGILGPVFIPFMVSERTDFLFWGWLKAYLSFSFYKVVAAATMSILGQLYTRYYTNLVDFTHPINLMKNFPLLIILVMVNMFMLLKIPALTATIFSGHSGGHDAGTGIAASLVTRGLMS